MTDDDAFVRNIAEVIESTFDGNRDRARRVELIGHHLHRLMRFARRPRFHQQTATKPRAVIQRPVVVRRIEQRSPKPGLFA